MTELDFDELDKAVNDLMQDAVKQDPATDVNVTAGQPAPEPVTPEPTPIVEPAVQPAAPAAAPLAMRRGRFMDVMAPSGTKKPLIDNLVAHKATTVDASANISDITPVEAPAPTAAVDVATIDAQQPPVAMPVANEPETVPDEAETGDYAANPAAVQEWPEPQEVTDQSGHTNNEQDASAGTDDEAAPQLPEPATSPTADSAEAASPEEVVPVHAPAPAPAPEEGDLTTIVNPDTTPESAPLPGSVMTSPFLPGAKVEKRPLGGDGTGEPVTTEVRTPDALPREYSTDLMNLETDNSAAAPSTPEQAVPTATAPSATATDAAAGTIFDTDTYHAPLKQPAKTKNGWLVLIWIFALLILGAIAGAAYYFYSIQQ